MTLAPVVLDNTVLTNFALAERPELVALLWGEAWCTTTRVFEEHQEGVTSGAVPAGAWDSLPILELDQEERDLAQELPSSLGPGERSCLALILRRGGTLVSDDLYARKFAAAQEIPVTGTLGILIGCIKKGLIDLREGNRLLKVMIDRNYHAPVRRLDHYL